MRHSTVISANADLVPCAREVQTVIQKFAQLRLLAACRVHERGPDIDDCNLLFSSNFFDRVSIGLGDIESSVVLHRRIPRLQLNNTLMGIHRWWGDEHDSCLW